MKKDSLVSRVDKIIRRQEIAEKTGGCSICPPNVGENANRKASMGKLNLAIKTNNSKGTSNA